MARVFMINARLYEERIMFVKKRIRIRAGKNEKVILFFLTIIHILYVSSNINAFLI